MVEEQELEYNSCYKTTVSKISICSTLGESGSPTDMYLDVRSKWVREHDYYSRIKGTHLTNLLAAL